MSKCSRYWPGEELVQADNVWCCYRMLKKMKQDARHTSCLLASERCGVYDWVCLAGNVSVCSQLIELWKSSGSYQGDWSDKERTAWFGGAGQSVVYWAMMDSSSPLTSDWSRDWEKSYCQPRTDHSRLPANEKGEFTTGSSIESGTLAQ